MITNTISPPPPISQGQADGQVPPQSTQNQDECSMCNTAFTHTSRPIHCKRCTKPVCKSFQECTGHSRYQLSRMLRDGKEFICPGCKGVPCPSRPSKKHPSTLDVTPGKCSAMVGTPPKKCGIQIKECDDFLICSKCNSHWHKKEECSGMKRKQIETLGDRTSWVCPTCISAEELLNQPPNKSPESRPPNFKFKEAKNTKLKILQWNVDAISSKKEELKNYVKKNNIDIIFLQETMMIPSDADPKIPGYSFTRKDRTQPKGKEKNRGGGLLIGTKNTIPFKTVQRNIAEDDDHYTEYQTIQLPIVK